jgi:hypothetical protein
LTPPPTSKNGTWEPVAKNRLLEHDRNGDLNRTDDNRRASLVSDEGQLSRLLKAIEAGDFADSPVDNDMLAAALQLSLVDVARRLQEAKARSLVWGIRSGRQPGPWYTDLEVTVQGQRFLAGRHARPTR